MMNEKQGSQVLSVFNSHHSRITALIITFFTTLITLSVFFYLSITPSTEFQDSEEFSLHNHHDEGNLNVFWGSKIPKFGNWKIWIGLDDGRDRPTEAQGIRELRDLFQDRFPQDKNKPARDLNAPALERLAHCIETNTCGKGEEKIVILATFHFNNAVSGGTSGEDIWARSTLEAFESLNYTLLYTFAPMDTLTLYQGLEEKVKTIIWEGAELKQCLTRNETNWESMETSHSPGLFQNQSTDPLKGNTKRFGCIKSPGFERGIPLEKSFTFHFWGSPENPLGRHFTLSPEDYASWNGGFGNHYLGYSIETKCRAIKIPKSSSEKKHRGMVLGKYANYFNTSSREWMWGKDDILGKSIKSMPSLIIQDGKDEEKEVIEEKFEMIATGGHDDKETGEHEEMYKGIKNLGGMPQHDWYQTLASSKFLLGVGKPRLSPSPYDALCFGVPFINPVSSWNHTDPQDWTVWYTQHDALRPYGPPYVYHVQRENQTQLEQAMRDALSTPIDRFIPPPMTKKSVKERHRILVETDWKPLAIDAIQEYWTDKDLEFPYLV